MDHLSALYLGPFAVAAYLRYGRGTVTPRVAAGEVGNSESTALAVLPGGGASTVAHLVAVPFVALIGWTIAGMEMWPMILVIAVLAIAMLTAYEYATSRNPHEHPGGSVSLAAALAVASFTVAFDIGMVGWMLLLHFNHLMPPVTEGTFWFLMQLGVVIGLVTAYPAVRWLHHPSQSDV